LGEVGLRGEVSGEHDLRETFHGRREELWREE
jgi:hypothetical protein